MPTALLARPARAQPLHAGIAPVVVGRVLLLDRFLPGPRGDAVALLDGFGAARGGLPR